jgi:hypothetical protein
MNLDEFKAGYLSTARVEFGDDGDYIVLREPTGAEAAQLAPKRDPDGLALFRLLPSLIVEHTFTFKKKDGTEEKAKAEKVAEMLSSRVSWVAEITRALTGIMSVPLTKGEGSATSSE